MSKEIEYLAFEGGGGKGIVYLGAVRAIIMLIIILSLPSCNAQESQKDTIPEEFEFINVFLPEKLEKISYEKLHNNFMKIGMKKSDGYFSSCNYYKMHLDSIIYIQFTPHACFNTTKDSIKSFSLRVTYSMIHLVEKDTISENEALYINHKSKYLALDEKKLIL